MKVYGVTAEAALKWAHGDIDDETLKAASGQKPEAVFIEWLNALTEYRDLIRECRALAARGAVCLVTRTGNPVVEKKLAKEGSVLCSRDNPPFDRKGRWLAPPESFKRWVAA